MLDAAEYEFAECGLVGAREAEIARRAGVTRGVLHYYFRTKQALYAEVLGRVFADLSQAIAAQVLTGSQADPIEALAEATRAANEVFCRRPRFVRIMLWEVAAGAPNLEAIAGPFYDEVARLVRATRLFEGTEHDARDVATSLLGASVLYFFDDPMVARLFGPRRFGPRSRARRGAHLAALARSLARRL